MKPLPVMLGPTGVGKTDLSIELAERIGAEIISADSMQIYRQLDIGTAKPTPEQRARVPHHLIDLVDPDQPYNVFQFKLEAENAIDDCRRRAVTPLVVGGSGLYLRAITGRLSFPVSPPDWELRRRLEQEADRLGEAHLHRQLAAVDPEAAAHIHPHDRKRTIRALEVCLMTGTPISVRQRLDQQQQPKYNASIIGLTMPRPQLYRRIDQRVDRMMEQGLLAEVEHLLSLEYDERLIPMRGLGYRHMLAYLRGCCQLDTAVELFKRDTRRFAKRQFTWFRREPAITWYDLAVTPREQVLETLAATWA